MCVLDNLSVGEASSLPTDPRVRLVVGNVTDQESVAESLRGCSFVFHLAAPTDVRNALQDPHMDIDQGTLGTQQVLEGCRKAGIRRLMFASSSCVYGNGLTKPLTEDQGPLLPVSVYGASKLAAEALISAYCHTFGMQSWIYRFPNVVGPELTHGVVRDFVMKLKADSKRLPVFGDGRQTKTYLWVADCVDGILRLMELMTDTVNVANVTTSGSTSVNEIASIVIQEMGLADVKIEHTGGSVGWPGDVPFVLLDGERAKRCGWEASYASSDSIRMAVRELI